MSQIDQNKMHQGRVVGGGNTIIHQGGKDIAFLTSISDTPPKVIGSTVVVQPLNAKRPVDIITGNAVGEGSMTLTLIDVWDEEAWNRLTGYENAKDILDVYEANRRMASGFTMTKMVKSPTGKTRGKTYSGCVISDVTEAETINIDTMTKDVVITVMYLRVDPV